MASGADARRGWWGPYFYDDTPPRMGYVYPGVPYYPGYGPPYYPGYGPPYQPTISPHYPYPNYVPYYRVYRAPYLGYRPYSDGPFGSY
jgi:hypothetical protein